MDLCLDLRARAAISPLASVIRHSAAPKPAFQPYADVDRDAHSLHSTMGVKSSSTGFAAARKCCSTK
jgi:hypothetical protein